VARAVDRRHADHNTPTKDWAQGIRDPVSRTQVETLDANIREVGAKAYSHSSIGVRASFM
jgi:hypothetical protein